jgi:hypothetical protein
MKLKYKPSIGVIALIIPFAAMLFMIGTNIVKLSKPEYRFAIEGYDPRDILRGHFLIFQYKWPMSNTPNSCKADSKDCCACVSGGPENPSVSFIECQSAQINKTCKGTLPVTKMWDGRYQPSENQRQYYIPEEYAKELESLLITQEDRFSVGITLQPNSAAQLKMLYIDGKPLPQFLSEYQKENIPTQ